MKIKPIELAWYPAMPIFASESFLRSVSREYGWLGGFNDSGTLICVLPYTILKKAFLRIIRFRVETIPIGRELAISEEKDFLNCAMEYFRSLGADLVMPATTNAVFRTYPDGADAAPYGSYLIDLRQPEETLWRNISKITRQNIGTAIRNGITIKEDPNQLRTFYYMIRDTFDRSNLPFMNYESLHRYVTGLGEYVKVMYADLKGVPQSCTIYVFSAFCAYAVYGGNLTEAHQGTMKLLQWEAIRFFQKKGVQSFDFVGARINPEHGSKEEALSSFKRRFGAALKTGFIWKYPFHLLKYRLYNLAAHYRSKGDIVDKERHKLNDSLQI
jgi:lipid II:glycine glycyltransferase (peptidoglycan interpeptide bridge formation enzyme)